MRLSGCDSRHYRWSRPSQRDADRLGISFADRPHGMVQRDWDALLAFGDKYLLGKPVARTFDQYPAGIGPNAKK